MPPFSFLESGETEGEPHQETDDEGIERDSGECDEVQSRGGVSIQRVLDICTKRSDGGCRQTSELHYRAVCRALVAEALELSTFLDRVSTGTGEMRLLDQETCRDLDQLNFQDWVSVRVSNRRLTKTFRIAQALLTFVCCLFCAVQSQDLASSSSMYITSNP